MSPSMIESIKRIHEMLQDKRKAREAKAPYPCPNCGRDDHGGLYTSINDVEHCGCYYDGAGLYSTDRPPPSAPTPLRDWADVMEDGQAIGEGQL